MKFTLGKAGYGQEGKSAAQPELPGGISARSSHDAERGANKGAMREIVKERKHNAKVYACGNGTKKAVFCNRPIHYYNLDEEAFIEIDNRLTDTGDGLETCANTFRTRFEKRAKSGKIFELTKYKHKVGLFSREAATQGGCMLEACGCGDAHDWTKSKVVLKNVKNNVDIEYTVDTDRVKEDIIVRDKAESYEFNFDLSIENLFVESAADGSRLELKSEQTGVTQFYIPAPFMTDAAGKRSDAVYYEIEQVTPKMLALKITADAAWINAGERVFPVTIDPQLVSTQYAGTYDGGMQNDGLFRYRTFENGAETDGDLRVFYGYVGYPNYAYKEIESELIIQRSGLSPSMRDNIVQAELKLTVDQTRSSVASIGFFTINGYVFPNGTGNTFTVDITDQLRQNSDNITVPFQVTSRGLDANVCFQPPVLELEYMDPGNTNLRKPEEKPENNPTLSYSCGSINAVTNLKTGELKCEIQDISFGSGPMAVSFSHIYSSRMSSRAGGDVIFITKDGEAVHTYMGKGFKLNHQQYLFPAAAGVGEYGDEIKYYYIDGAGAVHHIVQNGTLLYDTSGLGLTLTDYDPSVSGTYRYHGATGRANSENAVKVLTDRQGNKLFFDTLGRLVATRTVFGSANTYNYANAGMADKYRLITVKTASVTTGASADTVLTERRADARKTSEVKKNHRALVSVSVTRTPP